MHSSKLMPNINLKTERLNLRPISEKDIVNIHKLYSLPETDQFNTFGIPKKINETKRIVEKWVSDSNGIYLHYLLANPDDQISYMPLQQ